MTGSKESNGTGTWTRWCLGVTLPILVAVLAALATAAVSNRMASVENATRISGVETTLKRIEEKVDRLLVAPPRKEM